MRFRSYVPFALVSFLVAACGQDAVAGSNKLMLTGSSTVAPLAAEIAMRYEEQHAGTRIEVQTGGSSKGIRETREGLVGLGMASRALKGDESDELVAYTIARDGVALIVHRTNPVQELSADQVRGIFRGELSNWDQLGGEPGEITVINKASGRATLEVFLAHFGLDEGEVKADIIIGHNQQGIKTVAGNPLAIGYVSIGAAEGDIALGTPIRLLSAGGVAATTENVATGRFPISRPLILISRGPATGLALKFIQACRSEAAKSVILDLNFTPASL